MGFCSQLGDDLARSDGSPSVRRMRAGSIIQIKYHLERKLSQRVISRATEAWPTLTWQLNKQKVEVTIDAS